ncbi:D-2-hydroxyacid dehydrogenase [Hymenobacter psychrophilus]|uniref:Phosphoglycerate dehydrogenase n=1 Tax=Hymenobacter psychrophilus TaxID=651662 RepID=A0A1H3KJ73_9BACT|nr:D-2-hydroxyacid dehydrogenase [Hymenobacter psychrophilus]SDY51795.1 Phosphoglycerate dehydrogenase [Hymenobacter psychrophilus]
MHLFVYSDFSAAARAELTRQLPAGLDVEFATDRHSAQPPAALQTAGLLLGNPPASWLTPLPPQLRFWQIDSAGIHQYQELRPDFLVANMGDLFAWPCAETMVAGLLALLRGVPQLAVWQTRRHWEGGAFRQRLGVLRGRRVLVLGRGSIGLAVAQQLVGFGCAVQFVARTDPQAQLHTHAEVLATLPATDIVVNCLPGSATGYVSAELLAALPPHALYASVGRGSTTDEPALLAALQAGRLAGAVLDVTAQEPLPSDNPLWGLPQVLLTQHTGGGYPEEEADRMKVFLRNLGHWQRGEPLENAVTLGRGY